MADARISLPKTQKKLVDGQAPAKIRKAMGTYSADVQSGVADHYVDAVDAIRTDLDFGPGAYEKRMQESRDVQDYSKPLSSYLKTQMDQNFNPEIRAHEPLFRDYWRRVVSDSILADKDRAADVLNTHGNARMKPGAEPVSAIEKYYRANPSSRPAPKAEPAVKPVAKPVSVSKKPDPVKVASAISQPAKKSSAFGFADMQRELLNGLLEEEKRVNRSRARSR